MFTDMGNVGVSYWNDRKTMTSLKFIIERYPSQEMIIRRMFKEDESFQAFCDDYEACVNALDYWRESLDPVASSRIEEYVIILNELEQELHDFLKKSPE
jgi:hypothetical protein